MIALSTELPPARIIRDLPFAEYVALPGEHSTLLKRMHVSPLEYRYARDNPRADSDVLRLGRACHTAVIELQHFDRDYAVYDGRRDDRIAAWANFKAENEGKTILKPDQLATAMAVRAAVRAHPGAGELFAEPGMGELSIVFTHEPTGLQCKVRIDWLCSALVDLKSARDVTKQGFGRAAASLDYVSQMALYLDACVAAGLGSRPVKIVAVQSGPPFDVAVYDVTDEQLDAGRGKYTAALEQVAVCTKSGRWPGCAPDKSVPLELPAWAQPSFDETELTMDGTSIF